MDYVVDNEMSDNRLGVSSGGSFSLRKGHHAKNNPATSRAGYSIAFIATILWSTTGVLISYLSRTYQLPSLVLAFWRDLLRRVWHAVRAAGAAAASASACRGSQWGFMVLYGLTPGSLQFDVDLLGAV